MGFDAARENAELEARLSKWEAEDDEKEKAGDGNSDDGDEKKEESGDGDGGKKDDKMDVDKK